MMLPWRVPKFRMSKSYTVPHKPSTGTTPTLYNVTGVFKRIEIISSLFVLVESCSCCTYSIS